MEGPIKLLIKKLNNVLGKYEIVARLVDLEEESKNRSAGEKIADYCILVEDKRTQLSLAIIVEEAATIKTHDYHQVQQTIERYARSPRLLCVYGVAHKEAGGRVQQQVTELVRGDYAREKGALFRKRPEEKVVMKPVSCYQQLISEVKKYLTTFFNLLGSCKNRDDVNTIIDLINKVASEVLKRV